MSGLATAVERQVQTTSIFQAQPPFNSPITPLVPAPEPPRIPLQELQQPNPPPLNQPAPAPEPPRIPLQAVPHRLTAPSNWPQQQNSSIFQAQPFNSPTCTNLPAPSSKLPRTPSSPGYFDAMQPPTTPNGRSQQPNPRAPKGVPYGYSVMRF
ncbi:hypothetical protein V8E54_008618 [Elaphomyces granulatus]